MMSLVSDDRYFGVYPAIVTSNNDPFGFGRVQVTVPMVAANDALWATVVVPCTGQDGGIPPAVGTDVVVAFEVRSEVVASVGDLQDSSDVLLKVRLRFWPALQLLDYLLALIRRRCEEATQHGLCRRRCGQCCGGRRRLHIDRRHHLRVIARGVDDRTQIRICGRDAGPRGQQQCQSANCGKQSRQRRRAHLSKTFQINAPPSPRRRQHQRSEFESAATPHPCPLAARDQGRPDGPSPRVYRATQDRARQVLLDPQRKHGENPYLQPLAVASCPTLVWMNDERQALRTEGLDPDDPAVIAAIALRCWELGTMQSAPNRP
jgi:Type VI secretion system/phage-baseplate injector OB domain